MNLRTPFGECVWRWIHRAADDRARAAGACATARRRTDALVVNDLDIRSRLVANTMQEQLVDLVRAGDAAGIRQLFTRDVQDERIYAIAVQFRWADRAETDLSGRPRLPRSRYGPDAHARASFRRDRCTSRGSGFPSTVRQPARWRLCSMSFVDRRSADA